MFSNTNVNNPAFGRNTARFDVYSMLLGLQFCIGPLARPFHFSARTETGREAAFAILADFTRQWNLGGEVRETGP